MKNLTLCSNSLDCSLCKNCARNKPTTDSSKYDKFNIVKSSFLTYECDGYVSLKQGVLFE